MFTKIFGLIVVFLFYFSGRKRRGSDTLSDSSDEGEYGFSWSSSEERSATPVMGEVSAAMVLMNLSHAQMASKEATAMQQRMMQFMQRRGAAAGGGVAGMPPAGAAGSNSHASAAAHALTAVAAAAAEAVAASRAAEDTQNSPQGKNISALGNKAAISNKKYVALKMQYMQLLMHVNAASRAARSQPAGRSGQSPPAGQVAEAATSNAGRLDYNVTRASEKATVNIFGY